MTAQLLSSPETFPGPSPAGPVLHLLGGPYVSVDGCRREVPEGSKRLLAFIALRRQRVERQHAAGLLWPVGSDERAAGNLRSALWRLRGADVDLLVVDKCSMRLRDDVAVDVELVGGWAARLISGTMRPDELTIVPSWAEALELLPGWYDDWVLLEREPPPGHGRPVRRGGRGGDGGGGGRATEGERSAGPGDRSPGRGQPGGGAPVPGGLPGDPLA